MFAFLSVTASFQKSAALQLKPIRSSIEESISHQTSIPSLTFHVLQLRHGTCQCETASMCHRSQTSPPSSTAREYERRGGGGGGGITVYAVTKWSENKTKEQNNGMTTKKKQCSKEQNWYLLVPRNGRSQRVWIWHSIATLRLSQLSLLCRVHLCDIFRRADLAIKRPLSNAYMYGVIWKSDGSGRHQRISRIVNACVNYNTCAKREI
jgi:hypothetical protein